MRLGYYPIAGLVRRARRRADLSQRELARRIGVSAGTIGKIEAGRMVPSLDLSQRIFRAAGLFLAVVAGNGEVVLPLETCDDVRDGAGRRYPAHLDVIIDPQEGEWWADVYGLAAPPETFHRNRRERDFRRALSRWDVRAAGNRGPRPSWTRWLLEHPPGDDRQSAR